MEEQIWVLLCEKLTHGCTNMSTSHTIKPLVFFQCTKATLGYLVVQFWGPSSKEAFMYAFSLARVAPFALITVSTADPPGLFKQINQQKKEENAN